MPLALITGTARENSIAAGIVKRLVADGWTVATSDLDHADFPADLSDPSAPATLIRSVGSAHGPISALILSHAYDVESGILDTSVESFDRHIAVNTRASLLLIREFARQVPADGGAIVALTSDHTTGNLPYGASKGALDRIVISAARELAPLGISSNALNPGPIDTGWMNDDVRATITADQPAGRLGTPQDVAEYVAHLVSPAGRWVSGQLLHADGGYSAVY
ncbi:SDR family oxidoreductase [Leifsonia sp. NPDC058248]|uniref:SDR family oxidoreductase n=1 Tax=Leifsonia sp. NPDC058248 TaxID=3346402 RepID=UPI0036DDCDF4